MQTRTRFASLTIRALPFLMVGLGGYAGDAPAAGAPGSETGPAPGHSDHGQAFNEGPRQAAYRMKDTGKVKFAITTASADAQKYFNQGVGELHGFWYYEAERSFRQAASADPVSAMPYWGMAMANINNAKRAREFIAKAVALKERASDREKLWIDALSEYYKEDKREDSARRRTYIRALERIVQEYPKDIEAKAFLVFQIWDNSEKGKMAITSHQAVDSLLDAVFAEEPMHPAHHYRIHLWDGENPKRALESAARLGQSATSIAHMWHMPGHTFSKLHRHDDATWQQEAAHRTDLAYMQRDVILPDQIHNFAHNAEWLVRSYNLVGRVKDAVAVSKNMIEFPRHPKYNVLGKVQANTSYSKTGNTSQYGRTRLLETLLRWEQWETILALRGTVYLENSDVPDEQIRTLHAAGVAHFSLSNIAAGKAIEAELETLRAAQAGERDKALAAAEKKARDEFADAEKKKKGDEKVAPPLDERIKKAREDVAGGYKSRIETIENIKTELSVYEALAENRLDAAKAALSKTKNIAKERLARLYLAAGDVAKAEENARDAVKNGKNQVLPLAVLTYTLYRANKMDEARQNFEELRQVAADADSALPALKRLEDCRLQLGLPSEWKMPPLERADSGKRPKIEKLGPLTWVPEKAPSFRLPAGDGRSIGLADYRGKPVVVIFYLGHGCAHCIQQLNAFAPLAKDFEAQGIALLAVSTDSREGLAKTMALSKTQGGFPFPIVADPELRAFREYRCHDDFENKPLHGTFLIDPDGRLRWWDISYQPFEDTAFLLKESQRLLELSGHRKDGTTAARD